MDGIGTAMGLVTIPMACLTVASLVGGVWLLLAGYGSLVASGVALVIAGLLLALVLERAAALGDAATVSARGTGARLLALATGVLPMVLICAWELAALRLFTGSHDGPALARWLWCYGIATLPWTAFALLVGSDRRTLCGIRAYAGHLAYWLASALTLSGAPHWVAAAAMALPSILPATVGVLLAAADRDALRNVRI